MTQERDEWLMSQVAADRQDALETLVRRYANPLLTFIRRMLSDHQRSEEVFQDVFLAVWQKRRQYLAAYAFRPWLYAIAVNACRAHLRRRRLAVVPLFEGEAAPFDPDIDAPGDVLITTERATMVQAALATLPLKQRAVIALRTWSGLSYGEIAEVLGVGDTTVRAHMHFALKALREYLEPRLRA